MGEDLFFGDNIPTVGLGPTLGKAAHIKLQSFFAQNLKKFDRRFEKRLSRKRNFISRVFHFFTISPKSLVRVFF